MTFLHIAFLYNFINSKVLPNLSLYEETNMHFNQLLINTNYFFSIVKSNSNYPGTRSLQKTQGQFIAPSRISIYTENPEALKQPIEVLRKHFTTAAGIPVSVSTTQKTSTITLHLTRQNQPKLERKDMTFRKSKINYHKS